MGWTTTWVFLFAPFLIFWRFCSWKCCYLHDLVKHFLQPSNIIFFYKLYSNTWSLMYLKYTPQSECWHPAKKLRGLHSQFTQLGICRQSNNPSRPWWWKQLWKVMQYHCLSRVQNLLNWKKKHNTRLVHVDHYLRRAFPKKRCTLNKVCF